MKLLKGSFPQVVAGGLIGLHGGRESAPQRFKHSITIIPNSILPPQYIESKESAPQRFKNVKLNLTTTIY